MGRGGGLGWLRYWGAARLGSLLCELGLQQGGPGAGSGLAAGGAGSAAAGTRPPRGGCRTSRRIKQHTHTWDGDAESRACSALPQGKLRGTPCLADPGHHSWEGQHKIGSSLNFCAQKWHLMRVTPVNRFARCIVVCNAATNPLFHEALVRRVTLPV